MRQIFVFYKMRPDVLGQKHGKTETVLRQLHSQDRLISLHILEKFPQHFASARRDLSILARIFTALEFMFNRFSYESRDSTVPYQSLDTPHCIS